MYPSRLDADLSTFQPTSESWGPVLAQLAVRDAGVAWLHGQPLR